MPRRLHLKILFKTRQGLHYENIEVNLLGNGYEEVYEELMLPQNKIETTPDQTSYRSEYATNFPSKRKTRATAVSVGMDAQGLDGITEEIRKVMNKVVLLARGA